MTDTAQKIIDNSFDMLVKTYAPQPIVMDRGEGVYAWDSDGNKYVDFAIGIAVASLGHAHPKILKTLNEQAAKMMTCQASYATQPKLDCASLLINNSPFDLVYFSNSGTESVEMALKMARKWAYDKKGPGHNEIIAFNGGFHGRTYGAASVTYKRDTQPFFEPYITDTPFADFNDLESVKKIASKKTAAIIVEPIQGEGGLVPADPKFLRGLRALCDEYDIALIFDEVQAGMGRAGTFFAFENFKCCVECGDGGTGEHVVIEPDIICLAKGMGGGFPVGAVLAKKDYGDAIVVGTHGTTYGGNPLATAIAHTVMSELLSDGFLTQVQEVGAYFKDGLENLKRESNKITDIRGMGLMIGIDTTVDIKALIPALQKNGLLTTQAGAGTLRLTPPLITEKSHIDEALEIIGKTLQEEG